MNVNNKKILLIGGSGFLGSELGISLVSNGYKINILGRHHAKKHMLPFPFKSFTWEKDGSIPNSAMEDVDIIINLAGESIASGRWTKKKKKAIKQSRINATTAVVNTANHHKIRILIQASAIGIYGDTGATPHSEEDQPGEGFLAETVIDWEQPLTNLNKDIRLVTLRFGVILGTTGGAFIELLNLYATGLGANIGRGDHFFSWIHIQDVCRFIKRSIKDKNIFGIYNLTAPNPIIYKNLHVSLSKYFGGFSWISIPKLIIAIGLGEKSKILLDSQNVISIKMVKHDFKFKFNTFEDCLNDLIDRKNDNGFIFHRKQWLPKTKDDVWNFFTIQSNIKKIVPTWIDIAFKNDSSRQTPTEITCRLNKLIKVKIFSSRNFEIAQEKQLKINQSKGICKTMRQSYSFEELADGTIIDISIVYKFRYHTIGNVLGFPILSHLLNTAFNFERQKTEEILSVDI
ncbi:MAG: TIGR01777 family oxidoreductase [Bdellovibrionota bacterium]